jgi:hypothetical protein
MGDWSETAIGRSGLVGRSVPDRRSPSNLSGFAIGNDSGTIGSEERIIFRPTRLQCCSSLFDISGPNIPGSDGPGRTALPAALRAQVVVDVSSEKLLGKPG